jgi:hypothetical protein
VLATTTFQTHPWFQCAAICQEHVLLGDRAGCVYLLRLQETDQETRADSQASPEATACHQQLVLVATVKCHGHASLTTLEADQNARRLRVTSTGRDGLVCQHEMELSSGSVQQVQRHRLVKKLDWIEGFLPVEQGSRRVVGFMKNDLVVVDLDVNQVVGSGMNECHSFILLCTSCCLLSSDFARLMLTYSCGTGPPHQHRWRPPFL